MNKFIAAEAAECIGCHACEIACAVAHNQENWALSHSDFRPRIHVVGKGQAANPVACHHCRPIFMCWERGAAPWDCSKMPQYRHLPRWPVWRGAADRRQSLPSCTAGRWIFRHFVVPKLSRWGLRTRLQWCYYNNCMDYKSAGLQDCCRKMVQNPLIYL